VPAGHAREAAETLAREIGALPQACLRNDRQAVYAGLGLDTGAALAVEYRYGVASLQAGARQGAERFTNRRTQS
jgi:enoyl-CoA hydratase